MVEFERIVEVEPATGTTGACQIRFVLKAPDGAVQFVIGTDWFLPKVQRKAKLHAEHHIPIMPIGWDVGYHSPKPHV